MGHLRVEYYAKIDDETSGKCGNVEECSILAKKFIKWNIIEPFGSYIIQDLFCKIFMENVNSKMASEKV